MNTDCSTDLQILFHNINHTPKQTTHLLQEHCNHYDIICIQELYYGPIKNIPSLGSKFNSSGPGDRTEDDKYFGTQSNTNNWQLLKHTSLKHKHCPHPHIACYINK